MLPLSYAIELTRSTFEEDFELWPHPWHWPWIINAKFWQSCISGTGGSIKVDRTGCMAIGCWTHYETLTLPGKPPETLTTEICCFSRSVVASGPPPTHTSSPVLMKISADKTPLNQFTVMFPLIIKCFAININVFFIKSPNNSSLSIKEICTLLLK